MRLSISIRKGEKKNNKWKTEGNEAKTERKEDQRAKKVVTRRIR
jgi:hypothetical protein